MIKVLNIAILLILCHLAPGQEMLFSQVYYDYALASPVLRVDDSRHFYLFSSLRNSGSEMFKHRTMATQARVTLSHQPNNILAVGLRSIENVWGSTGFGTSSLGIKVSDQLRVGENSYLGIGIGVFWNKLKIDVNALQWDSQFNGLEFDPGLPSMESMSQLKGGYLDFALGIHFQKNFGQKRNRKSTRGYLRLGINAEHLSKSPGNIYFVNNNDIPKYTFLFAGKTSGKTKGLSCLPVLKVVVQGGGISVVGGALMEWSIFQGDIFGTKLKADYTLSLGMFLNPKASFTPVIILEKRPWKITGTYDFRFGLFKTTRLDDSAIELHLAYGF